MTAMGAGGFSAYGAHLEDYTVLIVAIPGDIDVLDIEEFG